MKHKFTTKRLEQLANCDLVFPDNHDKFYEYQEKYLRSIGATDDDIDQGHDLCPDVFWYYASDLVIELAQELLDERERKHDSLIESIEDIERELKNLKRRI
jgi:hypothetical protein